MKYNVSWEMEVDGKTPEAAAREALDCIINGTARVFIVEKARLVTEIDLAEYGNGGAKKS